MNRPAMPASPIGKSIAVKLVCLFALSAAALLPPAGRTVVSDDGPGGWLRATIPRARRCGSRLPPPADSRL